MPENNEGRIDIFNSDGSLKSKEQFTKDVSELYDEIAKEVNEEKCHCHEAPSFLDLITAPELQTDVENAIENFHFYTRCIYLRGDITPEDADIIHSQIYFYNKIDRMEGVDLEDRMPIKIYIDSIGGDLDACFSIISSIKTSITPVYTYNIGRAWSSAFFILICGHRRFGVPNSTYLFHEGSCGNLQDAHKYLNHAEFYARQLKHLRKIVLDNTEITEQEYDDHIKDDWWLDVNEAYIYDIIDEIISDILQEDYDG